MNEREGRRKQDDTLTSQGTGSLGLKVVSVMAVVALMSMGVIVGTGIF